MSKPVELPVLTAMFLSDWRESVREKQKEALILRFQPSIYRTLGEHHLKF